jgi:hypothetical protein
MMNSNLAPDCDVTHIWWISAFGGGRLVFAAAEFPSTFASTSAVLFCAADAPSPKPVAAGGASGGLVVVLLFQGQEILQVDEQIGGSAAVHSQSQAAVLGPNIQIPKFRLAETEQSRNARDPF